MMSGAWPPPAPSVWIGVDRAALERGDRVLDEARLVQRVGVDRDLHVVLVGDASGSSRSPPASCPSPRAASGRMAPASICSSQRARAGWRCPCRGSRGSSATRRPPAACARCSTGPGVQVVALVPVAGPVPPPIIVVTPRHQRVVDLLRADEVDVRVDAAGGDDAALAGDDLGARADHDGRRRAACRGCRPCRCRRCGRP